MTRAVAYALASTIAGLASGAFLGALGQQLSVHIRDATASILAMFAILIGGLELSDRRLYILQHSCETPKRWVERGAFSWALRNGATLGIGATTRIGFWLWYVVPTGALLCRNPALGAMLYGLYSLIRGAAVWLILRSEPRGSSRTPTGLWLIQQKELARILTAGQLIAVGVAVSLAIGL